MCCHIHSVELPIDKYISIGCFSLYTLSSTGCENPLAIDSTREMLRHFQTEQGFKILPGRAGNHPMTPLTLTSYGHPWT